MRIGDFNSMRAYEGSSGENGGPRMSKTIDIRECSYQLHKSSITTFNTLESCLYKARFLLSKSGCHSCWK